MKQTTRLKREVRRLSIAVEKKHGLVTDLAKEVGLLQEALRQLAQAESPYVRAHVRRAIEESNQRMERGVIDEN